MLGDGIVSFGEALRHRLLQEGEVVAEDRLGDAELAADWIAAGVNSISPCSLRNWTVISPGAFEIPSSR